MFDSPWLELQAAQVRGLEEQLEAGENELNANIALVKDLEEKLVQYKTDYANLIQKVQEIKVLAPFWHLGVRNIA